MYWACGVSKQHGAVDMIKKLVLKKSTVLVVRSNVRAGLAGGTIIASRREEAAADTLALGNFAAAAKTPDAAA